MLGEPRQLLKAMFDAAIGAASPKLRIPAYLPPPPKGRTVVIGAGKASAAMAKAVEDLWPGPLTGLVVTRYGHAVPCNQIEIVEARHPVPDENGHQAAKRMLEMVKGLGPDDLVLALISGGGSSLLSLPADGLTLEDKQAVNAALLRSGASIGEMNIVRKHLSAIKGGRLAAAAYPARLVTLVISDVPGDDPAVIASGPTVADSSTFAEARAVMEKYRITEPRSAIEHLMRAADETPKQGAPRLANISTAIIATPQLSLEAAADVARKNGVTPLILGDALEGEAREVGRVMAGIARQAALRGQPAPAARRLAVRGRNDRHCERKRTRRPQRRISAFAGRRAGRSAGRVRAGRRYRWRGWGRRDRRRHRNSRHSGPRGRARDQRQGAPCRQ